MMLGFVIDKGDMGNTSVVVWGDDDNHMVVSRTGEHELIVLDNGSTTSYVCYRLFPLHAVVFGTTPTKDLAYAPRGRTSSPNEG